MKIVLFALNGSYSHTNLAIRCLRAPLERAGFAVSLCEYNLRDRHSTILKALYEQSGDVYGFSAYIWNIDDMLSLASDLKKIRPASKIIFGGPEVSFDTERFCDCDFLDCVVSGEGEEILPKLCAALKNGETLPRVVHVCRADIMSDEGILYREDDNSGGSMLYYESSRGCPYSCAYCLSSATEGVRAKSVAQTLADLEAFETLRREIKIIKFVDRTFNYDVERANAIWEALLDPRFTKNYHFEISASLLNERSFEILSRFPKGKIQLEAGLQSTNVQTLCEVSRHIKPEAVLDNLKRIKSFGNIHVHLDLIAGLPCETYSRFAKSFDEAYFSCDMLQLGFLKLLHGTPLRRDAEKYGYCFTEKAPYTVLSSNWISYAEIQRLKEVSDILERYHHSGKFALCVEFATACMSSPFAFYEGLSAFISERDGREIQKISQLDAFKLLYSYAETLLDGEELLRFSDLMHDDFTRHEVRKLPGYLKK